MFQRRQKDVPPSNGLYILKKKKKKHKMCYRGVLRLGQSVFVKRRCWCPSDSSLWTSVRGGFSRSPSTTTTTVKSTSTSNRVRVPICLLSHSAPRGTFTPPPLPITSRIPLCKITLSKPVSRFQPCFGPHRINQRFSICCDDALYNHDPQRMNSGDFGGISVASGPTCMLVIPWFFI